MHRVDLNCDLGEGCGNDAGIMPFITSANIACGYHAGDAITMRRTIDLALEAGVNVGAHPGYADRENFGRTNQSTRARDVYRLVADQIFTLSEIANAAGARLRHVKPHGALYNQAAADTEISAAIAEAVLDLDPALILFGLSGSEGLEAAAKVGLGTAAEVFADRTYQDDATLTPRSQDSALITDTSVAASQAVQVVVDGTVAALSGRTISIRADTICIHGDAPRAVEFARAIRDSLASNGIAVISI